MSDGTELLSPGDHIRISSSKYPRDPNKPGNLSDYMKVEWVEVKDGVKIIWVGRTQCLTNRVSFCILFTASEDQDAQHEHFKGLNFGQNTDTLR